MKILFFLLLFCSFFFTLQSQNKKIFDLVKDFGAKADDKTDCYEALSNAAAAINKAGGGILNIPKGKYYIASYKIIGGDKKNNIADITFKNCKGLTINGNNSIIRSNGNFTRKADYRLPGIDANYSYTNTVAAFNFANCKNVVLKDVTLYGEVDKMKKEPYTVESPCYGVVVEDVDPTDSNSNILLLNVTAHHFASDGILVNTNGKNISITNCKSYCNARQGLSIVKGHDIRCYNSAFDSTGFTGGTYGWHAPGAGVDVENEFKKGDLTNISFIKCSFRGNKGFQIVGNLGGDNVLVDSCFISDKMAGYGNGMNGVGLYCLNSTISNSIIFATIQVDLSDAFYVGEKIQHIKNNIIYSGHRAIVCADLNRPVNIQNNILVMLPHPDMDTYFPYIQSNNCIFSNNITVVHPDKIAKTPNPVTSLVQFNSETVNNFWLLNKNNFSAAEKKINYYYPAFTDAKILRNQIFPETAGPIKRLDFTEKEFVSDASINKMLAPELFSAIKQNKFDKKYLIQATAVRKNAAAIIKELEFKKTK